jgi:hypothetical protein
MAPMYVLVCIATWALMTVALWLIFPPLGVGFALIALLLSEELLAASRAEKAAVSDWETRRKELGY